MFEPNSYFYLYLYPIISSVLAGILFWVIFSFFPERSRRRNFEVGISNDLISLNAALFGYFDSFFRAAKFSPSQFQDKIHSCSLTEEEINILLQNKIPTEQFNIYPQFSERMVVVGKEITQIRDSIDEIIKRLYAFNSFLSPSTVALLRRIQEKVFRYSFEREPITKIGNIQYQVVDPSLSYMTKVLLELQDDFKELRTEIFKKNILQRNFVISKIQALFYSSDFHQCIKLCNKWISEFPFDSDLQLAYKARSLISVGEINEGYKTLDYLLEKNSDSVSQRSFLYPLLSDPVAAGIIQKRVEKTNLDRMKQVCIDEELGRKTFLALNAELKCFFAAKNP